MKIPVTLELRALDSTDAVRVREWRNDYRVYRWCRQVEPISDVDQIAWYERQSKDHSVKFYGLWLRVDTGSELVGVAGLTDICMLNRRAEFSLYTAPAKQRQGIGRAALSILLDHAFNNLGLDQVWGECFHGNHALKLFSDLGFQLDGKRRGFYYKDGATHDAYLISILRSEWNDSRRKPDSTSSSSEPIGDVNGPQQIDAPDLTDADSDGASIRDWGDKPAKGFEPGRGAPWTLEAEDLST